MYRNCNSETLQLTAAASMHLQTIPHSTNSTLLLLRQPRSLSTCFPLPSLPLILPATTPHGRTFPLPLRFLFFYLRSPSLDKDAARPEDEEEPDISPPTSLFSLKRQVALQMPKTRGGAEEGLIPKERRGRRASSVESATCHNVPALPSMDRDAVARPETKN